MAEGDFGHFESLPDGARDVFLHLCQELANLSIKWRLYLDLFGNEGNRALIHDTAWMAFRAIEESLRIDLIMGLSRLADPAKLMGHENLSFAKLADAISGDTRLKQLVDDFAASCQQLLAHRNKLIAHNDLKTKLDPGNNLLPGIGRPDIEKVLGAAARGLNHLAAIHADTELHFEPPGFMDEKSLMFFLRKGWAHRRNADTGE